MGIICAAMLSVAGCANQKQTQPSSEKNLFLKSLTNDLADLPDKIVQDSKDTFLKTDNITALLLAGGASIAMHNSDADDNLAENFRRHQVIDGFASETLNVIGSPQFHFAATGLWYASSAENQDSLNTDRAWTMMRALAINTAVTSGLKRIRDNDTPNGKRHAWPSGHTSSSFTVASVLDEFYGPKVGIPAYLTASLVAYRMADEADHWASDIVFGATLGWVVGHSVAAKHKNPEIAGFKILPYTSSHNQPAVGINLLKQF